MPVQSVSKKKEKTRKKHPNRKPRENESEGNQVTQECTASKQVVSPSKEEIEKQLHELKEKGRELEEQLKMQEDGKLKKKVKHKSGSGAGAKKKSKMLTKQEVEGEIEEVRKTPVKKKPASEQHKQKKSHNNDPMKASILESLKKDIVKKKESSESSEDDVWTAENENLLQRHLQKFHDIMEVQPRRHTEAQIKMENQRLHEINVEKQHKELQRIRLSSITNSQGADSAKKKEEFLRKQQEKERKRNQEEMNDLQAVSTNKKVKSSREKRVNTKVKIPIGGQGLVQKHPKKTWGTVPSGLNLNLNDDTVWPLVKPTSRFSSTSNVWSERERKQQQLQTLIPKSVNEEEEMIRKALEMSKRTAEEELEFRRLNSKYYTPDDDQTVELLVNRLTMEKQQLAEWVQFPAGSKTGDKKSSDNNGKRDKSPPKPSVNPPVESTKRWAKWSLMDCQTDVTSNNPKEKLPAKTSSPQKKRSPTRSLLKPAEEVEDWSTEDVDVCMDMKNAPHRCFNTFKEMVGSEVRSDNCGADSHTRKAAKPEIFTFDEYYDPHGGARPKHQTSKEPWNPDPEFEPVNDSVWSPDPTIPTPSHSHKIQFSQRCTVLPEYETLSCSVLNKTYSHPQEVKVKVEPSRFELSYDSDGENWDGDIDYVGPECDPQTRTTHLSYSGIPKAVTNYDILRTESCSERPKEASQDVQVASRSINRTEIISEIPNCDQYQNRSSDLETENMPISARKYEPEGQPKGIRFMSARSKFAEARKLFLSSRCGKMSRENQPTMAGDKLSKAKEIIPNLNPNAEDFTPVCASIEVDTTVNQSTEPVEVTLQDATNIVDYTSLNNQYTIDAIASELNYNYLSDAYRSMYGFTETTDTKVQDCLEPSPMDSMEKPVISNTSLGESVPEQNQEESVIKSVSNDATVDQLPSSVNTYPVQECFETLQSTPESNALNVNINCSIAPSVLHTPDVSSSNLTQNGSDISIPIGLPPHLVNAYLLFLRQQENSESASNVCGEEQTEPSKSESIPSQPQIVESSNLESVNSIQTARGSSDKLLPETVNPQYPSNSISHMSQANLLKQAANQYLSNGNTKPAISEVSPSHASCTRVPKTIQSSEIAAEIVNGDAFASKCSLQPNRKDPTLQNSENLVPPVNTQMNPPMQNGFCGNPPVMAYNPVAMQQTLPMIYPAFNPFLTPVVPLIPKVYKSQVFDHSVQQQKKLQQQQQQKDMTQQQLNSEQVESNIAASSIKQKNHLTDHSISEKQSPVSNKERLKKKLECLNKVKSLMEEVRKDGGVIK